jgi:prepilin-type processing-associated H-X9-DG protein
MQRNIKMKTKKKMSEIVFLTLCCFINLNVYASNVSQSPEQVIKPCIDDQTFAIIHVNLDKVNIEAYIRKVTEIVDKHAQPELAKNLDDGLKAFQAQAQIQINEFMKAGGKDFFVVFSMYDFPSFFVAFPSGSNKGGLSQNILNIMKQFDVGKLDLYSTDGLILVGLDQTIARLKKVVPVQSDSLLKGFQACGDTTVQAVLFPSSDQRRILSEMLPKIPLDSGTINFTTVSRDLDWAALGFNGPPSTSLNVTVQSQNSEGADNLLTFIKNLYSLAEQNQTAKEVWPQLDQLLKLLIPEKHENQLVLKVEPKTADSIIDNLVATSIFKVRASAMRVVCAKNLKQIGLALMIYANDYGDKYPPNLEILTSEAELSPKILVCPDTMSQNSYIYRGADLSTSDVPYLVLAYDKKGNHEGGRNVLFLDGHVEWVSEEHFQELIKKDNEYREQKGYQQMPAQ